MKLALTTMPIYNRMIRKRLHAKLSIARHGPPQRANERSSSSHAHAGEETASSRGQLGKKGSSAAPRLWQQAPRVSVMPHDAVDAAPNSVAQSLMMIPYCAGARRRPNHARKWTVLPWSSRPGSRSITLDTALAYWHGVPTGTCSIDSLRNTRYV
jgi:hypothetical protein